MVCDSPGKWGIEISGEENPTLTQMKPVEIELYTADSNINKFVSGYDKIKHRGGIIIGEVTIKTPGGADFIVSDQWTVADSIITMKRDLKVKGNQPDAGFSSAIHMVTKPEISWEEVSFLAPGLLYGDASYDGSVSPGGTSFDKAKTFTIREDYLPAPLFGMRLPGNNTFTLLDIAPDGNSTFAETQSGLSEGVMIDERFATGAFGSGESNQGGIEIGFWMPNNTAVFPRIRRGTTGSGNRGSGQPNTLEMERVGKPGGPDKERWLTGRQQPDQDPSSLVWCRRYNPVSDGFTQKYQIAFRYAQTGSFPQFTKDAYRWAWDVLNPALNWHDIEVVRKSLADQLSSLVTYIDGRAGLPYLVYTKSGKVWNNPADTNFNWRCPMGFVGKIVEAGDELLREGDRDKTERGQRMRQQGLDIISTCLRLVDMKNPTCTGYNLKTGGPSMTNPPVWYVREATDDMRMLMEAYRREKENGTEHPEWIQWCKDFADWVIKLQREDGSFPRSFLINSAEIVETSGTTSYNVVPLFVMLSQDLKERKYFDSAVRAADYVWESFGKRGVFIGGAIDNPNITDKEAGLLSLEAFLFLYEETKDPRWLERARVAADFAISWTWVWNVPMLVDVKDDTLMWKRGIPTVGVQGITAAVAGHVDQFLDMSVPAYAKLYRFTGDKQYLEYARILLHNTKGMVAIPGRLHGMFAPGYQTENFRMGVQRGFGTPEKWMTWITTNHLYSIVGLEQFDKDLFRELCARP